MNRFQVALGLTALITAIALAGCAGEVGTTQSFPINVPRPADVSQVWDVELNPGAASIEIRSNAEALVQGTVDYNVAELKPIVVVGERRVEIRQDFTGVLPINSRNDWRLRLGRGVPLNLIVNTGASSGAWELGGLSLRSVAWVQGAADATLTFSEPNPERLDKFTFNGGAASMTVRGLANANIRTANLTAGAGALTLVFDGQLSADAEMILDGGVTAVTIYSGGNPIQLISEGILKAVDNKGWAQSDTTYFSPEWNILSQPHITIRSRLGVASLQLIVGK